MTYILMTTEQFLLTVVTWAFWGVSMYGDDITVSIITTLLLLGWILNGWVNNAFINLSGVDVHVSDKS